jgi:hypothetical protein
MSARERAATGRRPRLLPAWLAPALFVFVTLIIAGFFASPFLPPVRAERERAVAVGRAELERLTPPVGAVAGGTFSTIAPGAGPGVTRQYGSALSCQETQDYYAGALVSAGWSVWKAPYLVSNSDLIATYRKQAQGVSLKLILDCSVRNWTYGIYIIEPDLWNQEDQPEPA